MTGLGPGDDELIAAVARGDQPALLALYDRYSRMGYGLAYRILGDAGAAEEAVQDAYLRIWRRAATFDASRGGARSWLLTIVHHCAIDLLRRRAGAPPVVAGLDEMAERRSSPRRLERGVRSHRERSGTHGGGDAPRRATSRDRDGIFRRSHPPRDRGARRSAPGDGERPLASRVKAALRSLAEPAPG